ncbi:MAG: SDR family oxidoreductase [Chloroflexaceae bacterium]|nr:SDR family oxidoreductase [Chloroflexaceae bacterium]
MNVEHATVFVTGANRGIGQALIAELQQRGVRRIYAASRQPQALAGMTSELVVPITLDITNRQQVQAAVARASDTTMLINNAGALAFGSLLDSPLELIVRDMDTNYYGTLHMVRAFAPVIAQNGGGAIVNLLTMASLASAPAIGGYSASKAAAYSLTQAIRANLRGKGIAVHGVYPGAVDTEMIAAMQMPKTSPAQVAQAILEGVANGVEDIYPDGMAQQLVQLWRQDPNQLAAQLAAL